MISFAASLGMFGWNLVVESRVSENEMLMNMKKRQGENPYL